MQSGLLYCTRHIVAKPQAVDDGLGAESARGEGRDRQGPRGLGRVEAGVHTSAVAVVICVPPEAPTAMRTWPSWPTMMAGHMEESGCFPVAGSWAGTGVRVSCCPGHQPSPHLSPMPHTWLDEVGW